MVGSQLHWNYWAYHLELQGQSVFTGVWVAGLLFLVANIAILLALVASHTSVPTFHKGRLVPLEAIAVAAT